jgi:hypothetical protein
MTTGRINQITSLLGGPRPAGEPARRGGPRPRRGRVSLNGRGARGARPARPPPAYRGGASGHQIAPSRLLSAGPHAEIPATARTGRDGLRHTALGRGARPPRDRRRTAYGAGRLPPGYYQRTGLLASGQESTGFGIAGDPGIPGLQRPRAPPEGNGPRREPTPGAE